MELPRLVFIGWFYVQGSYRKSEAICDSTGMSDTQHLLKMVEGFAIGHISILPLICCMTLDKELNLSEYSKIRAVPTLLSYFGD